MKKYLLLLFMLSVCSSSFSQVSEHTFDEKVEIPAKLDYVLYTPEGYEDSKEDFPLIVFLHGAGERGGDLSRVGIHGPLKYIREGNAINAVILAPHCPEGTYWQPEQVAGLVKKVITENNIDEKRVYLTGLSMGGYGVWATGGEHPEIFAAMAPICGAIYRPIYRNAFHLKEMPIWVFHGALDNVVLPENSNKMVKALKDIGNDVKYTIYPFANHNSWEETYNNPEFYKWLLAQKKEN
ncbi:dienelactone hydrolase family protein [Gillisia mitskevichiae]|uniref:Dienelactone hydrolase family protein n=1 Tax=Gillisia mitskevichiae TaxID=270921 RepID=A0A495PYP2_9FLAO|nr:prolyl oligopeptidase family serine peptidase [Gillisia mitskevichiae]RKS55857.1 dienelactone hydrolase family protein [Gillisia mitskevichiae]